MNQKQKNELNGKQEINSIIAIATGTVIGLLGVAVGGVVALKNTKNRERFKNAFNNVKGEAINYIDEINQKSKGRLELIKANQNITKK